MIPLWDMANHEEGHLSTDYDDDLHVVKCLAQRRFDAGSQFTIFYGVRSNHDLLVHNGFLVEGNPHSFINVKLGVSKNDNLLASRCDVLSKLSMPPKCQMPLYHARSGEREPINERCLAFLRVLTMTSAEELLTWSEDAKVNELLQRDCDATMDDRALRYLKTRCSLLLKAYPTSREDDAEKLASAVELTSAQRFCILLRAEEKDILDSVVDYCSRKMSDA